MRLKHFFHRPLLCLALLAGALVPAVQSRADAPASVTPVEIKDVSAVNSGDTAWMLTSAALVLMMTGPGLALFYGGLVRRKNVLATMMQSFILMAVVTLIWATIGYTLAFDVGNLLLQLGDAIAADRRRGLRNGQGSRHGDKEQAKEHSDQGFSHVRYFLSFDKRAWMVTLSGRRQGGKSKEFIARITNCYPWIRGQYVRRAKKIPALCQRAGCNSFRLRG